MLTSLKFTAPVMSATDVRERFAQVQRDLAKEPPPRTDSFAEQLSGAVKRRLAQGPRAVVAMEAPDESFGRKLSDATKRLLASRGKTNQRPKYRPLKRRKPSKSD
jgi:hypothetical protein